MIMVKGRNKMFSSPPKMLLEFFNVFSVTHGRETAISWGLPAFLAASLLHVSKSEAATGL